MPAVKLSKNFLMLFCNGKEFRIPIFFDVFVYSVTGLTDT